MELEHFESLYPENTRFDEIQKIISYIKEGNSCQVVSAAGVGRSNFLGLLSYNRSIRLKHLGEGQKNFHFVLLNFSEIRKRALSDATKFIFLGILDSLRERGMNKDYEAINKVFKESSEYNDELVIFQGLKKTIDYLAIEKGLTLVLLFDRFEEYVPSLTSEFFANLRVLRNRAKYHFSVVFSLNRPLEDLIEPMLFADFFEFAAGRIVYLSIKDDVGLAFRIAHLEKVSEKTIDKKIVKDIIKLTNGHGKLTILCLETILSLNNNIPSIKEQLIEHLLSQRPIRSSLFAIWNSLNPSEQEYFIGNNQEPIFLEKINLCFDGNITIPLFEEFVKHDILTNSSKKDEKEIVYEKRTGEIKLGENVISDQLTASEFKLLTHLLTNKDKIVGKEDVVNAVWGDKTTTLGVTDQALDQLIFRLRKKIEVNPNKPEHLITVKGRGFKFTS